MQGKDAFYGLQTPGRSQTNRLKFGQITVIYGSKVWKLSRICFPYEPEELADIDSAREWIGVEGVVSLMARFSKKIDKLY